MSDSKQRALTAREIGARKGGVPLVMLAAHDFHTARLIETSGTDLILVGDSLGMVVQGHPNTIPVTVDDILYHTRIVVRGAPMTHIVADLPFLSYHQSDAQAIENAGKLMQDGGTDSVKLEGGVSIAPRIRALVAAGIPVMGHVGLGPQSVGTTGGFRIQGRDLESARQVIADADAVAAAGAYAVVIELVPAEVAALITERISIPTIGIGAGAGCDGQVLVAADVIGLDERHSLKFVRQYADVGQIMATAFSVFAADVRCGSYPSGDESYHLNSEMVTELRAANKQP